MTSRTYTAFVSSTYVDLKEHRRHVIDALRKEAIHVNPLEDWTAHSDEPNAFVPNRAGRVLPPVGAADGVA
jgi:hypothetical protein